MVKTIEITIKALDNVDIQNPLSNSSVNIKFATIRMALAIITINGKFFFMHSEFLNGLLFRHLIQTSVVTLQY